MERGRSARAGGHFLVEAFVPDLSRFDRQQRVQVPEVGVGTVHLDVDRHDPVAQRVDAAHVRIGPGGVRVLPSRVRYADPNKRNDQVPAENYIGQA
ncbi:MAG: hypothetical protein ACT4OP_05810 [Actinomycetota bacterium]